LSYTRHEVAEQSAQTDHARQNPQLSSGTVSRGGSVGMMAFSDTTKVRTKAVREYFTTMTGRVQAA